MILPYSPVPAEVEKPKSFPTPSEPLIKAWSIEKTPHAVIFANARFLPWTKMMENQFKFGVGKCEF